MGDIIDKVTTMGEFYLEKAIAQVRTRLNANTNPDPNCINCGNRIPAKRRAAIPGCALCIECQTEAERQEWHPET